MHEGVWLFISKGSKKSVCVGELPAGAGCGGAELHAGDGVSPPTALSKPRVYKLLLALASQQPGLSLGREHDSEGCLNHLGFPWARLGLMHTACPHV